MHRYWQTDDLTREARSLVTRIAADEPVAGVAGVPRSGMLAAAAAAIHLGVPLYEATCDGIRQLGHGRRLERRTFPGRIVVMDDSLNTGTIFSALRSNLGSKPIYASVFATERGARNVQYVGVPLELPHWFDWWLWHSLALVKWKIGIDFDGILCADCPIDADDDGERYTAWMRSVPPIRYTTPHGAAAIITGRLEKYRPETEAWMRRHNQASKQLHFGPWKTKAERSNIAAFKAAKIKELGLRYFIESDARQAAEIAVTAGVPVACPAARRVFEK